MDYQNLETVEELSDRLKVKKSWIYRQTLQKDEDSIPRLKVGKYLRFEPERVDAWLMEKQK